jgi:hypothetical protein
MIKLKVEKASNIKELIKISKKYYHFRKQPFLLDISTFPVCPIPKKIFLNTNQLEIVICPSYLKAVEDESFCGCTSLKLFDAKLVSIGDRAFMCCRNLSHFNFEDVIMIGEKSFLDTNLCEARLNVVKTIGLGAFSDCIFLSHVSFPRVLYIGQGAFMNTNLKKIILPETLEKIDDNAFYHNVGLKAVVAKKRTPPIITATTFRFTPPCPLYVLSEESALLYKTAPFWCYHFRDIRVIDDETARIMSI